MPHGFCWNALEERLGDRMRRSVSSRKADKAFDNEKRTLGAMEETDHEEDYQ
jgi:hypothetical protein